MDKVIIGIHGLGNKPDKGILERWWKSSMQEGLSKIGKTCSLPAFELVYWRDVIYDKPLNPDITDKNDPYYLHEEYTGANKGHHKRLYKLRRKIKTFLINLAKSFILNRQLNLKYPEIGETIIQRYFHELDLYFKEPCDDPGCIHCRTKKEILGRIVSILEKYQDYNILFIGHSMGSIIGFEVLSYVYPEINIHTFVTMGSPLGFPFVVRKIGSKQLKKSGFEFPIQTPSSIQKKWFNFSDPEDIIALKQKLSDIYSKNEKGIKPIDIIVSNDYSTSERINPHKSFGYLRTPEFAAVLSAFIEERKISLIQKTFRSIKGLVVKKRNIQMESSE